MDIDPRRLRVLLAVARTGGVLAAADELGITASAVSQQLNKLEDETGHAMVVRTPKGSVLTPAGLAVAEAGEEIERALSVARARIEAAYRRGNMVERRRQMMEAWAKYCAGKAVGGDNVVGINDRRETA